MHTNADRIMKAIEPVLHAHRDDGETLGHIPQPIIDGLRSAGVFRGAYPRALGGNEMDLLEFLEVVTRISEVDASAGWLAGNSAGLIFYLQSLTAAGAAELCADPDAIFAGAGFPPGAAHPVEGGFMVSGRHAFGTGSRHAARFMTLSVVMEGDSPRLLPSGDPELLVAFMSADSVRIIENWDTLGLRGTGSTDFEFENVFVAARHAMPLAPYDHPNEYFSGPLYRGGMYATVGALGAVANGISRAAIAEGRRIILEKTPSYLTVGLADNQAVQRLFARAEGLAQAATAYHAQVYGEIWAVCVAGGRPTKDHSLRAHLANCFCAESCARITEMVHEMVGTSGIQNRGRLARLFRDAHTISQHGFVSASRWDSAGMSLLGRQTDWGFLNL